MFLFKKKNNNNNTHTYIQTSLKICFAQISLDAQKILVVQILRGLQQPPPPPHPRIMRL